MAEVLKHHKARKRFGQNFLNDDYWIQKIADAVDPQQGQKIIEIGPGQAALTRQLIAGASHIFCVEIDRDLAAWLRTQFSSGALTIIEADALKFDWKEKHFVLSEICPTTVLLRCCLSLRKSPTV